MIKNFIVVAFRNFKKNRIHSLITIFGFAIGLAASILMASYIYFETSFDKFNKHYDDIYRIKSTVSLPNGVLEGMNVTLGELGPILQEQIPEIKKAVRLIRKDQEIKHKETTFHLE